MRAWLVMLGGLLVWAMHFGGVYGIASVFDVVSEADALASRWTTALFTGACLLADAIIFGLALRLSRRATRGEVEQWMFSLGAVGAAASFVAVFWQGLPALFVH